MKSVVGTFTSNKSAAQSSFSVTGLKFKPKVIFVRLLSSSNKAVHGEDEGSKFGSIDAAQIMDIDAASGAYMTKRTDLNDFSNWMNKAPSITFANGTLTVNAGQAYSTLSGSYWTIGTYEYRIYGV